MQRDYSNYAEVRRLGLLLRRVFGRESGGRGAAL